MSELLKFQCQEIQGAGIRPGENRGLEQERLRLKNAGILYEAVNAGIEAITAGRAQASSVNEVRRSMEKMGRIDPLLGAQSEACAEVIYRIEDIVDRLRAHLKAVETNEGRLEAVEGRLDHLHRLKRKDGGTLESVLETHARSATELTAIENIDTDIDAAKTRLNELHSQLSKQVDGLSKKRKETTKRFQTEVAAELATLKMKGTAFGVHLSSPPADPQSEACLTVNSCAVSDRASTVPCSPLRRMWARR